MVKKVLITGGTGYVGGRIARFLCDTGSYEVQVTTRRESAVTFPGIRNMVVDAGKDDLVPLLEGVDTLIHLAAMNEIDCVADPYTAIDVNVTQTLKWLKAAEKAGVKQFIYFSTIHVCGPLLGEIDEQVRTRPVHPYGITHKAAEDYVLAARATSSMDAICFRLSNSFGPPVTPDVNRWTLLVNDLCQQVARTGKMALQSDGTQERDFITLSDVVSAVQLVLSLDKKDTADGLFNLCSGLTLRVYRMAEKIAENTFSTLGFLPEINRPAPAGLDAPYQLRCSPDKLKALGWSPANDFDEELKAMLSFCNTHFSVG